MTDIPICIGEHVRSRLEFLPCNNIHNWADLQQVFEGNFQDTYVCPGNPWDPKSCK